jgi:hypothetical protein
MIRNPTNHHVQDKGFLYREDEGKKFLRKVGNYFQTTRCHSQGANNIIVNGVLVHFADHVRRWFVLQMLTYCHALGDRRRGIGLTIGFIVHFNQLQLSISIIQPPTLWTPLSIYPSSSLGSILDDH